MRKRAWRLAADPILLACLGAVLGFAIALNAQSRYPIAREQRLERRFTMAGTYPRVEVSTVNGSVDFEGAIRNDGVYRLSTHNGQVTLAIPDGSNATVSVSTYNGRYTSSFPVQVTQMGADRRSTFVLGNGSARIEASSFNGNIEFRRPGQPRP